MKLVDNCLEYRKEIRRFFLGCFRPKVLASDEARAEQSAQLQAAWTPDVIAVYELIREDREPAKPPTAATPAVPEQKNYIVWIDPDFDIDWICNQQLSPESRTCVSIAEAVGARRCKHLPREQVLELKRLVGQAIVSAIEGQAEQSRKLALDAEKFLKDRTVERSRSWTLTSAHIFVIIFSLIVLVPFFRLQAASNSQTADSLLLLLAIQGGIVGAYLSVLQKAGTGQWDAAAGRMIHHIEVMTKLIAGGIFGGLAFALCRSVHAPPSLKGIVPDSYSALVFGFAAGFIERLIPKMISTYADVQKQ